MKRVSHPLRGAAVFGVWLTAAFALLAACHLLIDRFAASAPILRSAALLTGAALLLFGAGSLLLAVFRAARAK